MATQAARGKKALEAKDYEAAIKEYSAAIQESPTSPDFYIQRSIAYQRSQQPELALADAEHGVLNAQQRAKKEAIVEAQLRRGIALWQLGRYGDAEFILKRVKDMESDHKQVDLWINKTHMSLSKLPEDDDRRRCTITDTPAKPPVDETDITSSNSHGASTLTAAAPPIPAPEVPQQTPADKIRYEWYQNTENIYFTLLAKGVPKDKAQVEFGERSFSVSFPTSSEASYDLTMDPLFAPIIPDKCITRVLPSKVEIILIKATPGQKWSTIESKEPVPEKADSVTTSQDENIKKAVLSETQPKGPVYPTSSKTGAKNWDAITAGDDDEEMESGDAGDAFFKKLYKNASPEMQRAMMKSYTESNGTALSTNWEEVSKGPVPTEPPSGMEAKEWSK